MPCPGLGDISMARGSLKRRGGKRRFPDAKEVERLRRVEKRAGIEIEVARRAREYVTYFSSIFPRLCRRISQE